MVSGKALTANSISVSTASRCVRKHSAIFICRCYSNVEGSGPREIEGKFPSISTSECDIAITDPYVIYQTYVKRGIIRPDANQLRAVKKFQNLYHRVINYRAPKELDVKISLLLRNLEIKEARQRQKEGNFWNNHYVQSYLKEGIKKEKNGLIKFMNDIEELENMEAPQGLLINGEVGCGKSMIMDIFASSLPHESKMRWHYHNFILWVFGELHKLQSERAIVSQIALRDNKLDHEFALYVIAQKMIKESTILLLDEFMLPDIASANIITVLFTYFFKLGGVLVATSNKLPENLYTNTFHKTYFKGFVQILHTRCETHDMMSSTDYRIIHCIDSKSEPNFVCKLDNNDHNNKWYKLLQERIFKIPDLKHEVKSIEEFNPKPAYINVYNRKVCIPSSFEDQSVCYLDFSYICKGRFSSSDYISLTSKYRVIIIDNVPVMSLRMKNEARRFITLLDAVYEAKCQFYMRSDVDIDHLFFPDETDVEFYEKIKKRTTFNSYSDTELVQDEETFAKATIDHLSPYRPNISSYDQQYTSEFSETKIMNASQSHIDFKKSGAFTGEDEKFAYKRAISRIKEMVASEMWRKNTDWNPLDKSMRMWERPVLKEDSSSRIMDNSVENYDKLVGKDPTAKLIREKISNDLPKDISDSHGISFRYFNARVAPVFESMQHFWGVGVWKYNQGSASRDKIARSWINSSTKDKD